MLRITSQRSSKDSSWKELHIKFALFPKLMEDGSFVCFRTYQELYYFNSWTQQSYPYKQKEENYLIRRNRVISNSIEDFKKMDIKEIKKTLDGLE